MQKRYGTNDPDAVIHAATPSSGDPEFTTDSQNNDHFFRTQADVPEDQLDPEGDRDSRGEREVAMSVRNTAIASSDADGKVVSPPTTSGSVGANINRAAVYYHGFSVKETAGAVATFNIEERDSADTLVVILDVVNLAAAESAREYYESGMKCREGNSIYLNVLTGTWSGTLRYSSGIEV